MKSPSKKSPSKIVEFEYHPNGVEGMAKSPSLWGRTKENVCVPLIYFKKPKWIPEKVFKRLLNDIME
jgi:hypothetical protein